MANLTRRWILTGAAAASAAVAPFVVVHAMSAPDADIVALAQRVGLAPVSWRGEVLGSGYLV
jgi:hypothetical protein